MKKALLILFVLFAGVVQGQEKEYYIGKYGTSLQASVIAVGIQANYHLFINPKAKFMTIPKVGIGYGLAQLPLYYNVGIDLAYGGKNRIFLGLGGYYNLGYTESKDVYGDVGYLLLGKKHLFLNLTFRIHYELTCECKQISPFFGDFLFGLGWKF